MSSSGGSRKQNERGSPRRGNSSRDGKGRKKDSPRNKPSVTNQTLSATTRTASGSANPPANSPCPQQPAHNPPPWTSSAPPFTAHFQTTPQPSFPPTAASQPDFAFFDSLSRFPDASASYYGTVGAVSVEGSRLPQSVLDQQLQSQHQHQQLLRFHHQQAFERQQYQQQFLQFQCQRLFQPPQQHQHQPQPHQHVFQSPQPPPSQQTSSFPANPSLTFRQPETDPFSGAPDVPRSYSGGGFPAPAFPQMNPAAGGQFLPPAPFMDSLRGPIDDPSPRGPAFPSPHPNAAPSPFFNQLPSYQTLPPALAPASAPSAPPPTPAHPPLAQHVIPQPPHPPPSLSLSSVHVLPPDHFSLVPLPEGSFSQTNSTASSPSGMYAMTSDLTSMSLVTPSSQANQQPGFFAANTFESGMSLVKVENDLGSQSNPLSPSSPGQLLSPPLTPAPAAPLTPSQRKRRQDPVKREPSEQAEKKVQAPSIRIRAESNRCTEITVPVAQPGENKAVHRFTVSVGKDPEQFQVHCNAIGVDKARIVVTSSREYATTHNFSRLHRMLLDCIRERLRQAGAYAPITVYEYATAEDALRASDQSYRSASDDEEAPEPIKTTCFKLTTYKKQ